MPGTGRGKDHQGRAGRIRGRATLPCPAPPAHVAVHVHIPVCRVLSSVYYREPYRDPTFTFISRPHISSLVLCFGASLIQTEGMAMESPLPFGFLHSLAALQSWDAEWCENERSC